ncbi:AlpA family phage regulatory protein [Methylobacterium sp. GC_Met_2]|uniref:helix-turn-helix transcriptional regulator n=1 Tax=Methylobacterium sp. GC_Met_2 TaxID=2937376 RepID=UPI00226BA3B9|nr:AlpA family phage regulatory protein [Methylobacterium sp. GC_Met_2]
MSEPFAQNPLFDLANETGIFPSTRVFSDFIGARHFPSATGREVLMKHANNETNDQLLRLKQVLQIIPMSRSKLYADIKAKRFPAPCKFGKLSFWHRAEVVEIVRSLTKGG